MGSWQGNPRNPTSTATIREEMSCRIDERYEHSIGPSAEITTLGCQRSSVRTSDHKGMVKGISLRTLKRTLWRPDSMVSGGIQAVAHSPAVQQRQVKIGSVPVRWGGRGSTGLVVLDGGWEEEPDGSWHRAEGPSTVLCVDWSCCELWRTLYSDRLKTRKTE